jgi:hypothetical protein
MKRLDLQDSDLQEMRKFYLEELDKTLERLSHIKKILEKVGGKKDRIEISIQHLPGLAGGKDKFNIRESTLPRAKDESKKPKARRKGRKNAGIRSAWARLILNQLSASDRPLTYNELTEEVMKSANIPEEKKESTKRSVVNVAFRLKNRDKRIRTFSVGQKEKYIARTEWFNDSGRIDKSYLQKIKNH